MNDRELVIERLVVMVVSLALYFGPVMGQIGIGAPR